VSHASEKNTEQNEGGEEIELPSTSRYILPDRPEMPEVQRPTGNLLELLDRILDKGVVIIGDIKISVADIELLKIQIRLLIASVDKAKELGIDFSWARGIDSSTVRALPSANRARRKSRTGNRRSSRIKTSK
jgi:hypothetical protein